MTYTNGPSPYTGMPLRLAASDGQIVNNQPAPRPDASSLPENDPSVRFAVRKAATKHQTFESALLAMVEAAGVTGTKATTVAQAIMANDELKEQAEQVFNNSGLHLT